MPNASTPPWEILLKDFRFGYAGVTLRRFVDLERNPEVDVSEYVAALEWDQSMFHAVQRWKPFVDRQEKWKKGEEAKAPVVPTKPGETPVPPRLDVLEAPTVLSTLGKHQLKHLVLALRLMRLEGDSLPRQSVREWTFDPGKVVKYAKRAVALCDDQFWANAENAFAAGAHYDLFLGALKAQKQLNSDIEKAMEDAFNDGLRIAKLLYRMSGNLARLELSPFAVSAGLLYPLGTVGMIRLFGKDYIQFLKERTEDDYFRSPIKQELEERARFGMSAQEWLSSWIAAVGLCPRIENALRYWNSPELLKPMDVAGFELAQLLRSCVLVIRFGASAPFLIQKFRQPNRRAISAVGMEESAWTRALQEGKK